MYGTGIYHNVILIILELNQSTNGPEFSTFPNSATINEGASARFTALLKQSTVQGEPTY